MLEMEPQKRLTLAVALLKVQSARVLGRSGGDADQTLVRRFIRKARRRWRIIRPVTNSAPMAWCRRCAIWSRLIGPKEAPRRRLAAMATWLPDQGRGRSPTLRRSPGPCGRQLLALPVALLQEPSGHAVSGAEAASRCGPRPRTRTFEEALALSLGQRSTKPASGWPCPKRLPLDLTWMPEAWWRSGHRAAQPRTRRPPKRLHRRSFRGVRLLPTDGGTEVRRFVHPR